MATRIENILTRVRDSLADEDQSRWSNDRLLRLIDEAQRKIVTKAQLLRKKAFISLIQDISEYQLPSDAYLLTRAVDQHGSKITIKSHADMDDLMSNILLHDPLASAYHRQNNVTVVDAMWENDTGSTIEFIIFDNQNPGYFKTYPILDQTPGGGEVFTITPNGVVVKIDDDILSSIYGVVVDVSTSGTESTQFSSIYGIVTDMQDVEEVIKIYYRAKPQEITSVDSVLDIDDKWDDAIKHYVVGMCLHDDQDTLNRQLSIDELSAYGSELTEAKKISSKDNTSRSHHRTTYNSEI